MKKYFSELKRAEIRISYWKLWLLVAIGYIAGLFVLLFDDDAAHHGAIALEMFNRGDWACLMDHENIPYLDKPHFQFWLVALSYKLLGIGSFSYRISSFVFTLFGLWATYRLASHLKDRKTGIYAAFILASSAAFALANTDVRMDAILTACIALAVWQGVMHLDTGKIGHLLWAALALAMAFGTKGWIGVMVPFFALVSYMVCRKQIAWLWSWKCLLLLVAFFLFITPVLYAYYLQFDMHPELTVRGEQNVSGVLFILWGQIFDRMGGTFGTTSSNDYFFFLHTLLWAVLPWSFLFYTFFIRRLVKGVKSGSASSVIGWLTLPAIFLTIAALSVSSFKLPHYLNVTFPLMAIFMASVLTDNNSRRFLKNIGVMQKVIVVGLLIGVIVLNVVCFPSSCIIFNVLLAVGILYVVLLLFFRTDSANNILKTGVVLSALVWFSLNLNFYPQLLTYQGGNQIAESIREKNIPLDAVGAYHIPLNNIGYSYDIYTGKIINEWPDSFICARIQAGQPVYLIAEEQGIADLRNAGYVFETVDTVRDYRITRLNATFLNPHTREGKLSKLYLVRVFSLSDF